MGIDFAAISKSMEEDHKRKEKESKKFASMISGGPVIIDGYLYTYIGDGWVSKIDDNTNKVVDHIKKADFMKLAKLTAKKSENVDNSDMRNITSIRQYAKRVDDILSKPRNWMQQIQKHIKAMETMDEDVDEFVREEMEYNFNEALDNFNSLYDKMEQVARIAKELVGRPTPKNERTLKAIEEKVDQKMEEMTAEPVRTEVKGPKKKRLAQWHR